LQLTSFRSELHGFNYGSNHALFCHRTSAKFTDVIFPVACQFHAVFKARRLRARRLFARRNSNSEKYSSTGSKILLAEAQEYESGEADVTEPVARLLMMYDLHGIPEEWL
jgi:hypothetical protein